MEYTPFRLPPNLLLGCATSATQIEGGDTNNSWYEWSAQRGRIKGSSSPVRANMHWEKYKEDADLMAKMGLQVYRMGLEWSRIEPRDGQFSMEAIHRYREEIQLLQSKGIRVLVTLHHFTNPLWFERMGAFEGPRSVGHFAKYVKFVVENIGDLITDYVTINEPNVYVTNGYVYGSWPPGYRKIGLAMTVMKHLALSHVAAYKLIHKLRKEHGFEGKTMVGFANHLRVFIPHSKWSPIDITSAKVMQYLFQDGLNDCMCTGRLRLPLGSSAPLGEGKFYDFIGINYYTRSDVDFLYNGAKPDSPVNDLGWEIYPEGLTQLVHDQYRKYRAPVWITENGTCDKKDVFRCDFIYQHLKQIADHHLPVTRYYHWTFMDNFEWAEGETAPFGLVKCDFETQERVIRKSGEFYREIIQNHGVTQDMIDRYLK